MRKLTKLTISKKLKKDQDQESPRKRSIMKEGGYEIDEEKDRGMKIAIRYLRNLGSFRRLGVLSPSSKERLFKPRLLTESFMFPTHNLEDESCSPVSP